MVRQDVKPTKWGKKAWGFIDSVVEGYDTKPTRTEERDMAKFLSSLGTILPCEKCRQSFGAYAKQNPVSAHTGSRAKVRRWLDNYKKKSARQQQRR